MEGWKGSRGLLEGREVSGVPLGGPGGVRTTSQRAGSGREDIPEGGKRSGGVGRPSQRFAKGREPLLEGQEGSGGPPKGTEGSRGPPKEPGGVWRPS